MTTPCAPAHSAVLRIAPRLCGSAISSHTRINGGSFRLSASAKISSTSENACTAAMAMTPWWFSPPHMPSSLRESTSFTGMPACFAMRRMDDTEPFFSPRRTRMLSMGLPALSASVMALRPAMTSLSLSFSMNKPIPFRGFRTRLRPKFAILSQYIVDYSILIFAIATETRNLARFLQAVFTPKTAVFLGSFFAALFSSF